MPNVPPLRFPEFTGEWDKTTIDNLAEVIGGGTPETNNQEYWSGDIIWYTPSEIGKKKYISDSQRHISKKGLENSSAKMLPAGTILLSTRATIGECSITLNSCTTNQGFQSLIARDEVNNEYLYYLIISKRKDLIRRACGSTFLEISANEVKKINVSATTIDEQNKLASFLALIDQRIETQIRVIDKLESLIKGIRATVFNNVQPNTKLGEIADIYQPQTIASTECNRGQYLVFGANGVIGRYEQYNHEQPQICITCRGNTCGTVNFSEPFSWITGNAMVINIDNNKEVNKRYLFHYLSSQNFHHIISGSGQSQIVRSPLLKFPIYLPSMQTQVKLAEMLDLLRCRLKTEQDILEKYQQQKAYLLQNMFI